MSADDRRPGPRCAVERIEERPTLRDAVVEGGGEVVAPGDAEALIWGATKDPDDLRALLDEHPKIAWVQLPFAGIEPYLRVLDRDRLWTCGKGVYADPVAEHALMLALAGLRGGARYARAEGWTEPYGRNLLGARVTILGGGEITRALLRLLRPFGVDAVVVRRHADPVDGARVMTHDRLHDALARADVVFLALALTEETTGIIDRSALDAMPEHAWLVNVARGRHVVTDDLVAALEQGTIGGAGLDVTDPEPLPRGHPLWSAPNVLITPHIGNTPEMGAPLLHARVRENVRRYGNDEPLLGVVDVDLGY